MTLQTVCSSTIQNTSTANIHPRVNKGRRRRYDRRRAGLKTGSGTDDVEGEAITGRETGTLIVPTGGESIESVFTILAPGHYDR